MLLHAAVDCFLFLLCKIPSCEYTIIYISIPLLRVFSLLQSLVIKNKAAMNSLLVSLSVHTHSFLLGIYLGMESLSHRVTLDLTFQMCRFSKLNHFLSHQQCVRGEVHILTDT